MIGKGGFSEVKKVVKRDTKETKALKIIKEGIINADPQFMVRFENDLEKLKEINHPHIAKIYDIAQDKKNNIFVI